VLSSITSPVANCDASLAAVSASFLYWSANWLAATVSFFSVTICEIEPSIVVIAASQEATAPSIPAAFEEATPTNSCDSVIKEKWSTILGLIVIICWAPNKLLADKLIVLGPTNVSW